MAKLLISKLIFINKWKMSISLQYTHFEFQFIHASHDSFNFNFIRPARISVNLLACVVAFCNSRRILQFEDTVRQSRYHISILIIQRYFSTPRFIDRLRKSACLSVLISITVRHLHNRRLLITLVCIPRFASLKRSGDLRKFSRFKD